jgi:hypothetical protein
MGPNAQARLCDGLAGLHRASLSQLIMAARLPGGGLSETAVNAALAFIEGAKPRDEVEAALVIQMAATHSATIAVIRRIGSGGGGDRSLAVVASAASRLLRAYAMQVETLRRLRNGGSQFVRVEHVHIAEGAQAVVGLVNTRGLPSAALVVDEVQNLGWGGRLKEAFATRLARLHRPMTRPVNFAARLPGSLRASRTT